MEMTRLLVLLWLQSAIHGAPDNKGKEFIIAFMDNLRSKNLQLELFVTTPLSKVVTVEVTSPKWTKPSINEKFEVTEGVVKQLFFSYRLRLEGTVMQSKGILVLADDEVVIYGLNKEQPSTDGFLGIPTDVSGTDYFTVTFFPPHEKCQICIVGIMDYTHVKIRLPSCSNCGSIMYNGNTYSKGETISITINRFEAIQLQSSGDLTGTYIKSSKPVTAFSGNKKTATGSGGSRDHIVVGLLPVDTWGKQFATVPTPTRTVGDFFKVVASEDKTNVIYKCNMNGKRSEKNIFLSKTGESDQISIDSKAYCKFVADKAIMLVMIVKSQISKKEPADPSMVNIPPIEQYAADYTFTTPKRSDGSYKNFFLFLVNKNEKDGLRLDGKPLPGKTIYNDIPETDLVGGYITIKEGSHTVRHISPISVFGGLLYGRGSFETYAFLAGIRLARINAVCENTSSIVGDGIDNDCDGLIDEELCTTDNNRKDDDGDGVSEEDCAMPSPIDGNWTTWGSWGNCSILCQENGTRTRIRRRTCTDPIPQYNGKQCTGSSSETETCTTSDECQIDGVWSNWQEWSDCPVICGGGIQSRQRECNNPTPQYSGRYCSGRSNEQKYCNKQECNIQNCRKNHFVCKSRTQCIHQTYVCDCIYDCDDQSDESTGYANCSDLIPWFCPIKRCPPGYFKCKSGECIDPAYVCDCINDCEDNSDESAWYAKCSDVMHWFCPDKSCGDGYFKCKNGSQCIESTYVCDCINDCDDNSDESIRYANCSLVIQWFCPNHSGKLVAFSKGPTILIIGFITILFTAIMP